MVFVSVDISHVVLHIHTVTWHLVLRLVRLWGVRVERCYFAGVLLYF